MICVTLTTNHHTSTQDQQAETESPKGWITDLTGKGEQCFPVSKSPPRQPFLPPLFHQPSVCKGQGHSGLPDSSSHLYTQQILECTSKGCTVVKVEGQFFPAGGWERVTYLRVLLAVH